MTVQVFRYGSLEPLPKSLRLTTSFFELEFLEGTLRNLRSGKFELLHSIYAVVRDENWETVPPGSTRIKHLNQDSHADGFKLEYERLDQQADIQFSWKGKVEAEENKLSFWLQGEARSSFKRNRIGFCVLHPMSCAGLPCQVRHVDGTQTDSS